MLSDSATYVHPVIHRIISRTTRQDGILANNSDKRGDCADGFEICISPWGRRYLDNLWGIFVALIPLELFEIRN